MREPRRAITGVELRRHPKPALVQLLVGDECIEVRLDSDGIHFRHPDDGTTEGHLAWDVALAMSLTRENRTSGSRGRPPRRE